MDHLALSYCVGSGPTRAPASPCVKYSSGSLALGRTSSADKRRSFAIGLRGPGSATSRIPCAHGIALMQSVAGRGMLPRHKFCVGLVYISSMRAIIE